MSLETGTVYFFEQGNRFFVPEAISIFGFSVSFYGIFLVMAALLGLWFAEREAKRRQWDKESVLSLFALVCVFGVLGARVFYVLFHWSLFVENPVSVFNFRNGGLSNLGALFGAWFAGKRYCSKNGENFETAADIVSIGAAAAAGIVWLGCALVREPIGRYYNGLLAVGIGIEYLPAGGDEAGLESLLANSFVTEEGTFVFMHPVAIYGLLLSLLFFAALFLVKRYVRQNGAIFHLYLGFQAVTVLVLEPFQISGGDLWGTKLTVDSIVAAILLLALVIHYFRKWWDEKLKKKRKRSVR